VSTQTLPHNVEPPGLPGLLQVPLVGSHVPARWHWSSAVHVTGLPPTQAPAEQVSVSVQAFPSEQDVPSGAGGLLHTPDNVLHTPATWHWSWAVHVTGLLPTHAPAWQASVWVQGLLSVQGVPSTRGGLLHVPVAGLHTPGVWHWSPSGHVTDGPPRQTPARQASDWVQAFPSEQDVPSVAAGLLQVPELGLQVPATWHWSRAAQVTGLAPTQAPPWQASVCVQALPSEQEVPSAAAGLLQAPDAGSQVPATWHWSWAVQLTGLTPVQAPAWQVSVRVHALPSLHAVPSALAGFEQAPVAVLHVPAAWH
jgi:hypothetical protein